VSNVTRVLLVGSVLAFGSSNSLASQGTIQSVRGLADMPNTMIRYYEVTGSDVTSINRSIARQRPKPVGGRLAPASTDWTVNVSYDRRTRDGQCQVRDARAIFTATADLPRLADEKALEPAVLRRWRNYVARLEESELATLAFVYSQLGQIEKQVIESSCADAGAAATEAIAGLQIRAAAFEAERRRALPKESAFDLAPEQRQAQAAVCKTLVPTGTRVDTLRLCMSRRDWQKLHESGQQATREMQDKRRVNRPF